MGNHRASVKIEFSMHGHTKTCDMWINYHPTDRCTEYQVDRRVLEWLTEQYEIAMGCYFDAEYDAEKMRQAEIENAEREELSRLKEKYDG